MLLLVGAFVGVRWIAESWAKSNTSSGMQYAGLSLYVVAEGVIFLPILWFAQTKFPDAISVAAAITLLIFAGLTAIVFITGADFSFLRSVLMLGGLVAFGLVICSMIFGFTLGLAFTVAMIALASGYILYDTSNVLHHYRIGQHVGASLALFASVALLFWYVLRLIMSLSNRNN